MSDPEKVTLNIPNKANDPATPNAKPNVKPNVKPHNAKPNVKPDNAKPNVKPENAKPAPEIVEVVKAANAAVNSSNNSAKEVAKLLGNKEVVNAAKTLVEKLKSPIAPPASAPVGGARKTRRTRAKGRKSRSNR